MCAGEGVETRGKWERRVRVEPSEAQRHLSLRAEQCSTLCRSPKAQETQNPFATSPTHHWHELMGGRTFRAQPSHRGRFSQPPASCFATARSSFSKRVNRFASHRPKCSTADKQTRSIPGPTESASQASHLLRWTRFGVYLAVPWCTGLGRGARVWQHRFL